MNEFEYCIVLVSTDSYESANQISNNLIENKLAACCTIINSTNSIFIWDNKTQSESELVILIKTKTNKLNEIIKYVNELHHYELPEIIALPIFYGSEDYLNWIDKSID